MYANSAVMCIMTYSAMVITYLQSIVAAIHEYETIQTSIFTELFKEIHQINEKNDS